MHKKYIIFFLLIHKVCAEEAKNFLSKLFVRRHTQTQPAEKEINWKAEAEYFNTKVVPAIDTVLNQYKEKMNQNALSTIDIKTLESILTYIDIGNQNFLKPRKSAKYEPIKAKTNRLRLAVYEYMYFNRSSDQQIVLNQIGNTHFSLTEEQLQNISNIDYGNPYVFKSIEATKVANKEIFDKKIKKLKSKSKEELDKNMQEYDKKIETLEGEIQQLKNELNALKEPTLESLNKPEDKSAILLQEKQEKEAEKEKEEKESLALTSKIKMITELEKFIDAANIVNGNIFKENDAWFIKNFTPLINARDTLITQFKNQYSIFLSQLFPNESPPWEPVLGTGVLLKTGEALPTDVPQIIDRDNLVKLREKITSKKTELQAEQESLKKNILELTTTIAKLEAKASDAANTAQIKFDQAFVEAKKTFNKKQNNILKQIADIEYKINIHLTAKKSLSITTEKELSDKIEQLKTAFIESNIDIKETSTFFYANIQKLSVNVEAWFTNLDQIATTIHMLEQLPKIESCYQPISLNIPYNERPKESIGKSITSLFIPKQASPSLEADICYLIIPNNDLLDFANDYETALIVIKDLLEKIKKLIENRALSANHQTIFNEAIVKQLLYKIKSIVDVFQNAFSTFYEKNNSQLKNLDVQISDKEAFSRLAKEIDQLIKQLSEDMSSINEKIDPTDKSIVNSIMEELIILLKETLAKTNIKYDLSFKSLSKEQAIGITPFAKRKTDFFNEFKTLNRRIILIELFNAFQYNWYTQSNYIATNFETLCKKDVTDKLAIVLHKVNGGIQGIINSKTNEIQNSDNDKTENSGSTKWEKQIELHTNLLHDVYEYLTLYQVCIIPLLKNELFTNIDIIEKVHETTKKIAEQMNTIINTFQDNSIGYIFKPKYGNLIKYCNKLKSLLKPPKEA